MKLTVPPEALAALNEVSPEPIKAPRPLNPLIAKVVHQQVARLVHGPSMKPTFRQQLLHYPSYAAIKAGWAADHFQRMGRERTRN